MFKMFTNGFEGWLLWNEMRKFFRAHPFFATRSHRLTMREAKALLRGRDIPDGKEMVRRIRTELNMLE